MRMQGGLTGIHVNSDVNVFLRVKSFSQGRSVCSASLITTWLFTASRPWRKMTWTCSKQPPTRRLIRLRWDQTDLCVSSISASPFYLHVVKRWRPHHGDRRLQRRVVAREFGIFLSSPLRDNKFLFLFQRLRGCFHLSLLSNMYEITVK